MVNENKPVANPLLVLREELDDSPILFDPDTGNVLSLNLVGMFIRERPAGKQALEDIIICPDLRVSAFFEVINRNWSAANA